MRITFNASGRRRAAASAGLCIAALLLLAFSPGHPPATTNAAPTADGVTFRSTDDHTAGSQIAKYEAGTATVRYAAMASPARSTVQGMDVSGHQGVVNWAGAYRSGARFTFIKATEGTTFRNPYFTQQYTGAANAGLLRSAYHFALPNRSGGAVQAGFFVANGGGGAADGATLPPVVDMEYNPYGAACYGLSKAAMVQWVKDFDDTVHARTGRWPTIYTSTKWWSLCTGDRADFSGTDALWVARYAPAVGQLPYAWTRYTFWQYASTGPLTGAQNVFNGTYAALQAMAGSASAA